ncbi:ABC transporter ATP-binding protein [Micromonospora sp. NPDC048835]|uniref:ABC transporter ATP-binding protein n=1 Tax=Micromonospora sp. NPDC048835 TaxID=3155147 RepID=UPI00340A773F
MTSALVADGLTKRYGRRSALKDCTLDIPAGHVVGLVGPNGAGKSTLLQLACGLLNPTAGRIEVLGARPVSGSPRVGFVAQDTPVYAGLTVADHLRMGAHLNPSWDGALAERRIAQVGLDPAQKAGKLSGGQRAQLALTVAAAKRPSLLLLDEPVAALDPLARRTFLQGLMELTAEQGMSIVMSSHLVADLERVCDHLIVLVASQVRVSGDVDDLLATHHRLVGQRRDTADLGSGRAVVEQRHTEVQSTLVVRSTAPIVDPFWQVDTMDLEDIVLAYLSAAADVGSDRVLEGQR